MVGRCKDLLILWPSKTSLICKCPLLIKPVTCQPGRACLFFQSPSAIYVWGQFWIAPGKSPKSLWTIRVVFKDGDKAVSWTSLLLQMYNYTWRNSFCRKFRNGVTPTLWKNEKISTSKQDLQVTSTSLEGAFTHICTLGPQGQVPRLPCFHCQWDFHSRLP